MILRSDRIFRTWLIIAIAMILGCVMITFLSPLTLPWNVANHRVTTDREATTSQTGLPLQPRPPSKPPLPPNDYVGSARCTECHPKIAAQYASHSMAKSMSEISTAVSIETFGDKARFAADQQHTYQVVKTSRGMEHHEQRLDDEGKEIYDQSIQMDYEIGSGAHGRSYLFRRGAMLFMSPISWYSKAQCWNLSPGYKLPNHRRFERRITTACLNCHVGQMNELRGQDDHLGKPAFFELSIGCERCHGPAGRHIAHHRETTASMQSDPIINPAKLNSAQREDVCSQCHLQGEGRIPNYGCEITDYRPGQRLEETSVVFVNGTRTTSEGQSRAVSHVDQMRASECYQKSSGKLGCTSCHNPHSMPPEPEKQAFYRDKCLSCHEHEQQGCRLHEPVRRKLQADDSCVACHMPARTASDIPHTSHTDHRILRVPITDPVSPPNADLPVIFDSAESRLPKITIDRARGLWLAERAESKSDPMLARIALDILKSVILQLPDDADVLEALGTASAVNGRLDDSMMYWKLALAQEPNRELTLRTTALTLQNTKRADESLPFFEKYLETQPWNASMWGRFSHLEGMAGHWKKALEAAKTSEQIDPSAPRIYQWLSKIHEQLGNEQESLRYQNLYERIRP
jgi:hypothetical protein